MLQNRWRNMTYLRSEAVLGISEFSRHRAPVLYLLQLTPTRPYSRSGNPYNLVCPSGLSSRSFCATQEVRNACLPVAPSRLERVYRRRDESDQ